MTCRILLYTLAGKARAVGEELAWQIGAQLHEIEVPEDDAPGGALAKLKRGMRAFLPGPSPDIFVPDQPWNRCDLLILGTPDHSGQVAPPLRKWLDGKPDLPERIAFFVTTPDDTYPEAAFEELERLTGRTSVARLHLTQDEVAASDWSGKIARFLDLCVLRYRHSA